VQDETSLEGADDIASEGQGDMQPERGRALTTLSGYLAASWAPTRQSVGNAVDWGDRASLKTMLDKNPAMLPASTSNAE
jgi:hypothetical protein